MMVPCTTCVGDHRTVISSLETITCQVDACCRGPSPTQGTVTFSPVSSQASLHITNEGLRCGTILSMLLRATLWQWRTEPATNCLKTFTHAVEILYDSPHTVDGFEEMAMSTISCLVLGTPP